MDGEVEKPLIDNILPSTNGYRLAIVNPTIEGNRGFEIKMAIINMSQQNQFLGAPKEDPNEHISNFNELCGTFQVHNISADANVFVCSRSLFATEQNHD